MEKTQFLTPKGEKTINLAGRLEELVSNYNVQLQEFSLTQVYCVFLRNLDA